MEEEKKTVKIMSKEQAFYENTKEMTENNIRSLELQLKGQSRILECINEKLNNLKTDVEIAL